MAKKEKKQNKAGRPPREGIKVKDFDKSDFKIDFNKIKENPIPSVPKPPVKNTNMATQNINIQPIRDTSPKEENIGRILGVEENQAMSPEELKSEKDRRKKLIANVTSKGAHILDNTPLTKGCTKNPDIFCKEEGCTNWKIIDGEKRCIIDALNEINLRKG